MASKHAGKHEARSAPGKTEFRLDSNDLGFYLCWRNEKVCTLFFLIGAFQGSFKHFKLLPFFVKVPGVPISRWILLRFSHGEGRLYHWTTPKLNESVDHGRCPQSLTSEYGMSNYSSRLPFEIKTLEQLRTYFIVQELCESRGGRPGLSVLTSFLVSVDVKVYWTMLRHWSQLVPNMSTDIRRH